MLEWGLAVVGAGPGAPDLITLRGLRYIQRAHTIIYDRLASRELLAHARPGAELIYAGKEPGRHAMSQEEINRLAVERALEGKLVVRLHGGDPLLHGRGEEECAYALARGVPCEVVPGVPSPVGAAAEHLIPLAGRGVSSEVLISTGTYAGGRLISLEKARQLVASAGHSIFLMATRSFHTIVQATVQARGPQTPIAIVERATLDSRLTLARARELLDSPPPKPPAVIFVGGGPEWRMERLPAKRY